MLSKFFLRAAVTAAALTCTTGSASAEEFRIMMMETAFFPDVSYVQPGDTVTFVNMSGTTRTIQALNNDWAIADMPDGAETAITVSQGWKSQYLSRLVGDGVPTDLSNEQGLDQEEGTIMGVLSLSQPPRGSTADGS